jgi:MarR family transcriptional regulator for hemolysin
VVQKGGTPIGLELARSAKSVGRAFGDALAEVGGSVPMWLVLTALKGQEWPAQLELARALDIESPTLTRHLDGLENAGLVTRERDPADRRAIRVALTEEGHTKHAELLQAVIAFNRRLRSGLSEDEIETLRFLLQRLNANIRKGERASGQERVISTR